MLPLTDVDYALHGPVTAVSAGPSCLCFAVGNRVLGCNVNDFDVFVVAQLPHGAAITAVEQHTVVGSEGGVAGNLGIVVLVGSGDRVYAAPLHHVKVHEGEKHPVMRENAQQLLSLGTFARVLCIQTLGINAGVLVLTTLNSVVFIPEEGIVGTTSSSSRGTCTGESLVGVASYAAKGLGVALAASALVTTSQTDVLIFTGTYAGGVAVWGAPIKRLGSTAAGISSDGEGDNHNLPLLSWIAAHRPGCAIFAVKTFMVTECRDNSVQATRLFVATCSDDRTAKLYKSYVSNDMDTKECCEMMSSTKWVCCWCGEGATFSRRRLFDIAVLVTEADSSVLIATGGEDGAVHVFSFQKEDLIACTTSVEPRQIFTRVNQHNGSGVYKVELVGTRSGSAPSSTPSSCETALVSCGVDGCVYYTKILDTSVGKCSLISAASTQERQHVRGIYCDENGVLLACTEIDLIVVNFNSRGVPIDEKRLPLVPGSASKKNLPSCLSAILFSHPMSPSTACSVTSLALVGTVGGAVHGIPYNVFCAQLKNGEEDENSNWSPVLKRLTFSLSSSKVIHVMGLQCPRKCELVLATIHASGQLIVSISHELSGSPTQWMTAVCAGAHTTALNMRLFPCPTGHISLCVFVGDDRGELCVYLAGDNESNECKTPLFRERIFQNPIASVQSKDVCLPRGVAETQITALSSQGEWRTMTLDRPMRRVESQLISCPLLLPWRVSSVLAWLDVGGTNGASNKDQSIVVTLFGTDVTVFVRCSQASGWHPVAQYHNVRAPRLLSATISPPTQATEMGAQHCATFICHCSDGEQGERFECSPSQSSRLVFGGIATGRDYNAVLILPEPVSCVLCGAENSVLTVLNLHSKAILTLDAPTAHLGPHTSNILGIAMCDVASNVEGCGDVVRFVTVGGLATIAVWEWSPRFGLCVVDHVNILQHREPKDGKYLVKNPAEAHNVKLADGRYEPHTFTRCVPRFLCVCTTAKEIVVGCSDGSLRIFELGSKLKCSKDMTIQPQRQRSVNAVSTLSVNDRLVVAGDTGGAICLCCCESGTVRSRCVWKNTAVNAISCEEASGRKEWRVLAAMDSGDVVLLLVTENSVQPTGTVRVGLTAARGVCWLRATRRRQIAEDIGSGNARERGYVAIVATDERVSFLQIDGDMPSVAGERRVNVRGVSGIAVSSSSLSCNVCAVVGQGIEVIPLQ